MHQLKILNSKETKKMLEIAKDQHDCDIRLDYSFLESDENKIYLINKDIAKIDLSKLRLSSVGLYFGRIGENGFEPSIEGSQMIGPDAKKNVVLLNDEEVKKWLRGEDIEKETNYKGIVLLKNNENDFLGCGRIKNGKIINLVPKERRLKYQS
ncbi:MAG: hypothetical protein Q7J54_04560 [Candidatus Woesearchaeota archaeon]|nr:hypothetical protein [Candidatus Woesearchaeota archaeon]